MDLVYFAVLCSVLIFVHELGHFIWAKIFGVKVLTFSIGFGPKIVRIRGRETEYCIGILPLGGFVQMLEETRQESVLPEDRSRTFDAQPLYKRAIIVLAGPAMNLLFPVLLYFGVLAGEAPTAPPTIGMVSPGHPADGKLLAGDRVLEVDGEPVYTFDELRRKIAASPERELLLTVFRDRERTQVSVTPQGRTVRKPFDLSERIGEIGVGPSQPAAVIGVPRLDSPAYRAGLRTFDVVVDVRGKPIKRFAELEAAIAENRGETIPVTFLRPVRIPTALGSLAELSVYEPGVAALTPDAERGPLLQKAGIESADLYLRDVPEGSPEAKADLRAGDRIVSVDNQEVLAWVSFTELLFRAPDADHTVAFDRNGIRHTGVFRLRREIYLDEYGSERPRHLLRARNWAPLVAEPPVESPRRLRYAFVEALEETYEVASFIVVGVVRIAEGKIGISTLGGPITVYDVVGEESKKGISYFVWAMALISINLGLLNLLPIPVLDGGHLVFLALEGLLRRPLPLRFREIASLIGMLLLLGLMGVAFKNDIDRRWDVIGAQVEELVP